MSAAPHKDATQPWLILFFICFLITVVGIGVFQAFNYKVDAPAAAVSGGH